MWTPNANWLRSGRVSTTPGSIFDLGGKNAKIAQLDATSQAPDFWGNQEKAQALLKEITLLRRAVAPWETVDKECRDLEELVEMLASEDDEATEAEVAASAVAMAERLDALELQAMLSEETDPNNAYLHIHAGAGGTESCDWASMLLRMYLRWCERRGFKAEELEAQPGEEAGIKSTTLLITGEYAYGYLKSESGVHRLVRISPFDAAARRHTSFASVYATPEIADDVEIEIKDEDIKVDTFRSSGAGGQHVNRTESAIRITHLPTNIVVSCQNDRSQHKNRATAMKVLRGRIYQFEMDKKRVEQAKVEGQKMEIGFGSQIRSYVFQPYQLVKDVRTGQEMGNIQAVMDGDIDTLIESVLRQEAGMESKA